MKKEIKEKKCIVSPFYGKDNNKNLHFYCKNCGKEMEYNEDRICKAMMPNQKIENCNHHWGYKTIGGFPGHEHEHITGGLVCFNCGISLKNYIKSEKEKLLERIKLEKKVESDFLDWHSDEIMTTELPKEARKFRDIYNSAVKRLETLKEEIKNELKVESKIN